MAAVDHINQAKANAYIDELNEAIFGQDLDADDVAAIRQPARRVHRSKEGARKVAEFVLRQGQGLPTDAEALHLAVSRKKQKRAPERTEGIAMTKEAMAAHEKRGRKRFDGRKLLDMVRKCMKAREEGKDKYEADAVDPYLARAKQVGDAKAMRAFLLQEEVVRVLSDIDAYRHIDFTKLGKVHHVAMTDDGEDYVSITELVVGYFAYKAEMGEEEDEEGQDE